VPIKPENRGRYPADWRAVRERILARAGNRCERCGAPNGRTIRRLKDLPAFWVLAEYACTQLFCGGAELLPSVQVVLTVAHLNHTPEDCRDEVLQALCQRCHNVLDMPHRQANAAETRAKKLRQQSLFEREINGK
jgi:hypothetical protein